MRQKSLFLIPAIIFTLVWPWIGLAQPAGGPQAEEDAGANLEHLRVLTERGDRDAQYRLGMLYEEGEIVDRDIGKAIELYQEAAKQGHPGGQYALALLYQLGSGLEQDTTAAMEWYRKAAQQGHELSQLALGDQYRMGLAVCPKIWRNPLGGIAERPNRATALRNMSSQAPTAMATASIGMLQKRSNGTGWLPRPVITLPHSL